jgi:hypothetical protein
MEQARKSNGGKNTIYILYYIIQYYTPWGRMSFEKLIVTQLAEE